MVIMKAQVVYNRCSLPEWLELLAGIEHQWGANHRADCDLDIQTAGKLAAAAARNRKLPPLFVNASLGVILLEPDRFLDLLQASKTPHGGAIGIELTEHGVDATHESVLLDFAREARERGFLVALDDARGEHLFCDGLVERAGGLIDLAKVDMRIPEFQELCRKFVALGIPVVAEGIETFQQLLSVGLATYLQGHLLHSPTPLRKVKWC
jgi:EAL domain-containing protein (putative c-di-GMP-specific phosphodiesterase class I)